MSKPQQKRTHAELRPELLRAMADGSTNKEIAYAFGMSTKNVDYHIQVMVKHYGAKNKIGLIVSAIRAGDLSLED